MITGTAYRFFNGVPNVMVYKYEPHTGYYILTCLNIQIGFRCDNGQIFNNNKYCKALVTKNCPRSLINAKLEQKKTQNVRKKKCQWTFQSKWLANFCQLRLEADSVSYCLIWRKYPDIADQKSLMFIGKIMNRV